MHALSRSALELQMLREQFGLVPGGEKEFDERLCYVVGWASMEELRKKIDGGWAKAKHRMPAVSVTDSKALTVTPQRAGHKMVG